MNWPGAVESIVKNSFEKASKKSRPKTTKPVKQTSASSQKDVTKKEYYRDKDNSSRSYVGFQPKSIQVIWEQFNTIEKEVMPEVYGIVAEDVTYRIWNIIHAIKTYGRHSGGLITCDIVNEVFKDSDDHPILGLDKKHSWNKVECDGHFYFKKDVEIELREEYLSSQRFAEVPFTAILSTSWTTGDGKFKVLRDFSYTLCAAIFLGDEKTYEYGLEVAMASPQISCVLKIIFRKCLQMLLFEQTQPIIERCVQFFRVLAFNINTHVTDIREQYYHLAEIFTSLIINQNNSANAELENNIVCQKINESNEGFNLNHADVKDNLSSCEVAFQMKSLDEFQEIIKKNDFLNTVIPNRLNELEVNNLDNKPVEKLTKQKSSQKYNQLNGKTYKVAGDCLCNLYSAMGGLAINFGCFQNECRIILIDWIKRFFDSQKTFKQHDFDCFFRVTRGLIVLGDYPFRDLSSILTKIAFNNLPESICNIFNLCAVYLHGRQDIFLHEWLEQVCGDMMQPFMLFLHTENKVFESAILKDNFTADTQIEIMYRIHPKIEVESIETHLSPLYTPRIWFPEPNSSYADLKQIQCCFSRCKSMKLKTPQDNSEDQSRQTSIKTYAKDISLSRRKLLMPFSSEKQSSQKQVFSLCQI